MYTCICKSFPAHVFFYFPPFTCKATLNRVCRNFLFIWIISCTLNIFSFESVFWKADFTFQHQVSCPSLPLSYVISFSCVQSARSGACISFLICVSSLAQPFLVKVSSSARLGQSSRRHCFPFILSRSILDVVGKKRFPHHHNTKYFPS